jgi:hypothetical protein
VPVWIEGLTNVLDSLDAMAVEYPAQLLHRYFHALM